MRRAGFGLLSAALVATSAAVIAAPPAQAATTELVVDTLDHAVGDWAVPGERTLYAAIEEANALTPAPGDDVVITFDDALTGNITVDTGPEIAIRQSNDNIGALGDTVDYLGNGAFYYIDAEAPVRIDFGDDVGFEHTFDQNYAAFHIASDDVTIENFAQIRAGASGVVVGNGVSGATVRNGSMVEPGINMETGIGVLPGVRDLAITDVTMQNIFRFGVMFDRTPDADTDVATSISGVLIDGLDASETEQFGDIWFLPQSVASDVTVTGSSFNSPRATNVHFHNDTAVTNMVVTQSTFTGGNPRASITAFGDAVTEDLQITDNEFTGAWVFEDYAGRDGSHTGLTVTGNRIEEAQLYALDFNNSRYTDTLVENNDFINAFGGPYATVWMGVNSGTVTNGFGGGNVVRANRFIQQPDYIAENGARATNRWAVYNEARATTATDPTGWSITENFVEGYQGRGEAPIVNIDRGTTEIWGNTFGPNTTGSLDRAETEVGSRWFVWNRSGLANGKIQTWRVTDTTYAGNDVTVTAASVEPLRGNNEETEPVELHAYWTAGEHAEVYLGKFTGDAGEETFSVTATDTFTSADIDDTGTVRVQTIDAGGNSSQYSGEGDGEPDLSFACETGTVFISQDLNTQLSTAVQSDGGVTFEPEGGPSGIEYNALGFNEADSFLYAIQGNDTLVRIGEGGVTENLGPVTGLPTGSYNQGSFGTGVNAGTFYVRDVNGGSPLVAIDVTATPATAQVIPTTPAVPNLSDFVSLDGFLFGQIEDTTWRIDPATGVAESFATGLGLTGNFGGQWSYGNGDIGLSRNVDGRVLRIRVNDPASATPTFSRVFSTNGPATTFNDAAACIGEPADVDITKTGPATYVDGDVVTYTLTVTNNGPGDSSGSMVTDPIPAGLADADTDTPGCDVVDGELNCIFGSLLAGDSQEIELTGTATGGGDPLVNVATVVGNDPDPDVDNNTAQTTAESNVATPVPAPDTCGTDFVETFGQGTGYGPQLAPGVTDYVYQGAAAVGVDGSTNDGEYSIVSDATIAGDFWHSGADNTGNPNGQFMLVNADADPGVFYQRDVTGLEAGAFYLLSAAVANANAVGSPALPNVTLRIVDPRNDAVVDSISTGTVANAQSLVWTEYGLLFRAPVGLDDARLEVVNNARGGTGNDLAIDDVSLALACPELEVVKTADLDDTNTNGLGDAGEEITYSFEVTNTGNVDVDDVSIDDPLAGLSAVTPASVPTLAPGGSTTFTATYTITAADLTRGRVDNQATVNGSGPGNAPVTDESDPVVVLTTTPVPPDPGPGPGPGPGPDPVTRLVLDKSANLADTNGNGLADAGETIDYTFAVSNTGTTTVTGVQVDDPKPGLSAVTPAQVASLAAGASAQFTASYVVTEADVESGDAIVNTATANGQGPGGAAVASAADGTQTPVADGDPVDPGEPALDLVKAGELTVDGGREGRADVGDVITYTFTVTNTGDGPASDVTIIDELRGLSAIRPASIGTLAAGATATFTATYDVKRRDVRNGGVENEAQVSYFAPGAAAPVVSAPSNVVAVPSAPLPAGPKSQPKITTKASAKRVRLPIQANGTTGSVKLFDRVRIRNFVQGGNAKGRATLYGPTSNRSAQMCRPANKVATVRFDPRNGRFTTRRIAVSEPGYYTWVVSTTGDRRNRAASHRCGLARETTLVHRGGYGPVVVDTGVGDPALSARAADTARISRVQVPALGLDAPVDPVGRDGQKMVIPSDVDRAGWLRISAGLGEKVGSTVIAGHVSDNSDRPGQFGKLQRATKGQVVTVSDARGRTQKYRINRIFSQPRTKQLPKGLFSTTKQHRLVLVTCTGKITYPNGRFHYTRNQVVVAKPIS